MVNSKSSSADFMPAVSTNQKFWPLYSALAVMLSRVVPASRATMASRLFKTELNKLDLPTLALPTIATIGAFLAMVILFYDYWCVRCQHLFSLLVIITRV